MHRLSCLSLLVLDSLTCALAQEFRWPLHSWPANTKGAAGQYHDTDMSPAPTSVPFEAQLLKRQQVPVVLPTDSVCGYLTYDAREKDPSVLSDLAMTV